MESELARPPGTRVTRTWKFPAVAVLCAAMVSSAYAQIPGLNTTTGYVRAQARPDECFIAIGQNLPFTKPPCFFGQPKVNQSYAWAMTQFNDEIWFGTAANPECITQAVTFPTSSVPYQTASWVCEFNKSPYASLLGMLGDFRPARMYVYNETTKQNTDVTPLQPVSTSNPLGIDPLLYSTLGIRAAVTTLDGYILLAGQALSTSPQMNFFVYNAATHAYVGSATVSGYDSIRQLVVTNGQIYAAVGMGTAGGAVLRYTGTNGSVQFQQIATLDGPGAYITAFQNRLFVATWPTGTGSNIAGLFMSTQTLPITSPTPFRKVWDASNYEPDPVIAASYATGALAAFGNYLYWGTMHVPWAATGAFVSVYGTPATNDDWVAATIGTFRTATIFRGQNFDTSPNIDLLYGSPVLPAYTPPTGNHGGWNYVPNNMPAGKSTPLYGLQGFGNVYNNYTWSMTVWDNRLWIGTMDWSFLAQQGTQAIYAGQMTPVPVDVTAFFALQNFGADLFFFQDTDTPAVPENQTGIGNYTSYGVRNMVPATSLFLGMANASNLLANGIGPQGGWEVIELQKKPQQGPLILLTGFSCNPAVITGAGQTTCTATTNFAAPAGGAKVSVIPVAPPNTTVMAPVSFTIPPGQSSSTVALTATDVPAPTNVYLLASLNQATRFTSVTVNTGTPQITATVAGSGQQSSGVLWVDLKLTNTGTGNAQSITLTNINVPGPGKLSSPALPISAGNLVPGASTTVRVYLTVPDDDEQLNIMVKGNATDLSGKSANFSPDKLSLNE